jgi:SAM-dependent methyltransferase
LAWQSLSLSANGGSATAEVRLDCAMRASSNTRMTFRRYYLDQFLANTRFSGSVLDIGGKKERKRGAFRPPVECVQRWEYLNTDPSTNPDYLCSAEAIPVADAAFDLVLMTEVLEHLEHPERVLTEAVRVLKPGGRLIATMPFLFPIHADPYDFQRWTPQKLTLAFEHAGLQVEQLEPMGSVFAVLHDLLYVSLRAASKQRDARKNRLINRFVMPAFARICVWLDRKYAYKHHFITTGYYVAGIKGTPGAEP